MVPKGVSKDHGRSRELSLYLTGNPDSSYNTDITNFLKENV